LKEEFSLDFGGLSIRRHRIALGEVALANEIERRDENGAAVRVDGKFHA
jgi:hypothetical protein